MTRSMEVGWFRKGRSRTGGEKNRAVVGKLGQTVSEKESRKQTFLFGAKEK